MKPFRNFLVTSALLLTVLSLYIPVRYQISYPREIGPQFDDRIRRTYINILDEQQPDMLLFGDSMLAPAVDEGFVESQVGVNIHTVSLPGTASTLWYLILKNNIVLAEHKPAYLVMFFRDTMMTLPGYRVTGRYFEQIDEFASPDDRVLIERAYINQMTALEKFLEANFPLYGSRWTIRQSLDYYIRYPLGNTLLGCDQPCMDYAMEAVFAEGNLDITFLSEAIGAADENLYTDQALDFNGQVALSFLPEIVRLCRENGIQLVLVRMPILRYYDPAARPAGLDGYIQDLSIYLKENNVPFLDFDQKDMPPEFFTDTLHLNEQGKALFTEQLTESLLEITATR
jgi:hypothetical protein